MLDEIEKNNEPLTRSFLLINVMNNSSESRKQSLYRIAPQYNLLQPVDKFLASVFCPVLLRPILHDIERIWKKVIYEKTTA